MDHSPRPTTVLFDVGGPIDTEEFSERLVDRDLLAALDAEGVSVSAAALADASERAVACFAPDCYASMIWTLVDGDTAVARRVHARFREMGPGRRAERGGIELRPGMASLLHSLRGSGVSLGLVANQPMSVLEDLAAVGLGGLFTAAAVSGGQGVRKPDPRLFLQACDLLGVAPSSCVMVGDRIDNDIGPARALRMGSVRFRTGRHRAQRPRSWNEVPHHEVDSVDGLQGSFRDLGLLS